jgi:hypothetical protein
MPDRKGPYPWIAAIMLWCLIWLLAFVVLAYRLIKQV